MSKRNNREQRKQEQESPQTPAPSTSGWRRLVFALCALAILLAAANLATYLLMQREVDHARRFSEFLKVEPSYAPLKDFNVANAHEHLFSEKYLDKYLEAANATGVVRTLFVASSEFTLMGSSAAQDRGNDENSTALITLAWKYPDRIVAFCTVHPDDPAKLDKIKEFVNTGARGLKLYTGHSNFHNEPLDDEDMMPVYEYCNETRLPICWHINLVLYADEFERVMERFPELIVIVPHFGVTFYNPAGDEFRRFQSMLDRYPNLYTDTSFGTRHILVAGLESVSRNRNIFKTFCEKYADRILFGTDMVVTGNKEKSEEWIEAVLRACRDLLEKDAFHFFMGAKGSPYALPEANNTYGAFRGLNLNDDVLRKIYETNLEKILPSK